MGKKAKRKQAAVPHKEALMRMNFLYQAAAMVGPYQSQLARYYMCTMKAVSQKLVLRMDPSIKRTICKRCDALLIPGVTCTHRLRVHREGHIVVRCSTCGALKRFLLRKNHKLWTEQPANIQHNTTSSTSDHIQTK